MSAAPGLSVHVGSDARCADGVLRAGWDDEADVPFRPGDDFPFEDAAVDALSVEAFIGALAFDRQAHLLLECRRVLRAGGALAVACIDRASAASLRHTAALVGLTDDPAHDVAAAARPDEHSLRLTKPDRLLRGDPQVSILIPAYNPRHFAECLDSALAQTYDNVEIVVCDDSAQSDIEAIVEARAQRRAVRYERNETRLRPRGNFVRCFERASGEFVKFLCDDDLLAPTCVERLLGGFRAAPDIVLATSRRTRIDASGRAMPDQPATLPIVGEDSVIAGHTLANAMLVAGLNTIGEPSTTLFRRSDFVARRPRPFHFRGVPGHGVIDMVMWTSLLLKGNAVYLREPLSSFRVHPNQRQHDPVTRQRSMASIRSLQEAWLELNVHQRHAPNVFLSRPFPPGDADWHETRVLGLAAVRVTPRNAGVQRAI